MVLLKYAYAQYWYNEGQKMKIKWYAEGQVHSQTTAHYLWLNIICNCCSATMPQVQVNETSVSFNKYIYTVYHKKGTAYFIPGKQTSAYKLVQLSSFTGFCWCCRCSGYFKICGVLNIQRVFSRKIQNVDELRQRIVEEWERLDQRVIDNAVKQWHRRLRSCVAAKGGHFEQML